MKKGIHEGDPLSPYLYVIVAKALHFMFQLASSQGLLCGFRIGRTELEITHLQYTDDMILFLTADVEELKMVRTILVWF